MAVTIPANDRKASNLLLLSYSLALITLFIQLPPGLENYLQVKSPGVGTLLLAALLLLGLLAGLVFGIRHGYRAVKIFVVLATVWDVISYIVKFPPADGLTLRTTLLLLAAIAKAWAAFIVARDLLRRPLAAEAGGSVGLG